MAFFPWDNQNNIGQDQEALRRNSNSLIDQLFGGWNNFVGQAAQSAGNAIGHIPQAANDLARTHPLVSGAMDGIGEINKGLGRLEYNGPRDGSPRGTVDWRAGTWFGGNGNQPQQSTPSLPGISDVSSVGGSGRESSDGGKVPLMGDALRMQELDKLLGRDFQPSGEYNSMIEQAYAGALANIGQARGQANENFQKSDAAINDLTQGHVHEIKTNDRAAVANTANNLTKDYTNIYNDGRQQLQQDQSAEMNTKAQALARLGIAEAGMGDAGKVQGDAIQRMTQDETGAKAQAAGYKAADLTRNTELAASQAGAGVERRSALHNQLQKILGNIGDSEAQVQQSMGLAKLQGAQNEKADFRQEQQFNLDSKNQILKNQQDKANTAWDHAFKEKELAAKNSSSSTDLFDNVGQSIMSRGIDPQPYLDAYNEVMGQGYNQNVNGDKNSFYAAKMEEAMRKKGLNPDKSVIGRVVLGINQSGTNGFAK